MTTADEWRDLARRCREAKILDVEIDAEICIAAQYTGTNEKGIVSNVRLDPDFSDDDLCFAVDGVDDCCNSVPELTGSIDAIVALIEKTMPGAGIEVNKYWTAKFDAPVWSARLWHGGKGQEFSADDAPSAALALCAAYCEARAAVEDAARAPMNEAGE